MNVKRVEKLHRQKSEKKSMAIVSSHVSFEEDGDAVFQNGERRGERMVFSGHETVNKTFTPVLLGRSLTMYYLLTR